MERWVERSLAKAVAPFLALDVVVSEAGGDMPTLTRFRRSRPAVGSRGRLDFFGAEPSEAAATGRCAGGCVGWVGGLLGRGGARIGVCSASRRRHAVLVGLRTSSRGVEKTEIQNFRAWKSTEVYLVESTKRRSGSKAVARQQG